MMPQEFKCWIEDCIRNAKKNGLSDEDILFELMEQVKIMTVREQIKILGNKKV